jgi:hypothetical protein
MAEKFNKELEPHHAAVLTLCEEDSPEQLSVLAEALLLEAGKRRRKREGSKTNDTTS